MASEQCGARRSFGDPTCAWQAELANKAEPHLRIVQAAGWYLPASNGGTEIYVSELAKRLRAAGEAALQNRLASEIGATRQVLIESAAQGRTEHFLPVAITGERPGAVMALAINGHDGARLTV